MLTTVQSCFSASSSDVSAPAVYVELALGIVVQHEQPQRGTILPAGVAEHRDVAVRVAGGEDRTLADAAPDANRLDRPVVEEVPRRLVRDGAAVLVVGVGEGVRAADHALGRDAVDLLGHGPHEVAVAAGGDVVREPVRLEVAQQLDHRQVAALVERAAERRVLAAAQERVGGARVVLDVLAGEGLQHAAHQHAQVAVVAVVVLVDRPAEPRVVLVVRRLPRLLRAQRLVLLRHLGEAHEDEAELDRHRLLAPERAVVVVHGDPLGRRHVVRPALRRHALDEVDDRRARRRVVPGADARSGSLLRPDQHLGLALQVDVRVAADVDRDPVDRPAGERVRGFARVVVGHRLAAVPPDEEPRAGDRERAELRLELALADLLSRRGRATACRWRTSAPSPPSRRRPRGSGSRRWECPRCRRSSAPRRRRSCSRSAAGCP